MKITKWNPVNKGNLLGFVSVEFKLGAWGNYYINSIAVCEKNGFKWINMPNKPYEDDGVKKYMNYCGLIERESQNAFKDSVLSALDTYIQQHAPNDFGDSKGQSQESYKDEEVPF